MSDDLISRQATIDEIEYELEMINSALDSITLDYNTRERLCQRRGEAKEILNSIQQLPSAQKRGKWKYHYEILEETADYVVSTCGYECSECGTIFHNQWDFCGNCGAVMEKADEN